MSNLITAVNQNSAFQGRIDAQFDAAIPPVTATPAATAVVAAKAAGAIIGGGAVTGAAYAAYNAVAG